ncbi:MAG TPA: SPOR domain-containing protein [Thermoanaerobaculia bacterium]
MAESHEPSYYEIALTNRQVIVAFVILLVCLLSAFFSGVWIGREGTARAQERLAGNLQQRPPASQEGRQLQELEFFDSDSRAEETASPDQDATEPPPADQPAAADTTLLEDFAGEEPEIETQPAPEEDSVAEPATPPAAPAKAPEPQEETREERRKRLAREREERRADAEPAKPAAAPARAPEPKVPKGAAVIQVFSSADQEQAERIRERLVKGGYKAYLSPVETGGKTMYRVRIGPYGSRSDADTAAENVRKNYKLDTWVTE